MKWNRNESKESSRHQGGAESVNTTRQQFAAGRAGRTARGGVFAALGVVVMMLGGVIPLATFACPALAGIVLLPVLVETGKRMALGSYVAISVLSLILCPDKEMALVFAFLGYYPVVKWDLERIRNRGVRLAVKLGIFNGAAGAMMLMIAYVLQWQAIMAEYAAMSAWMLAAFVLMSNATMLLYDRTLVIMMYVYLKKLRPNLVRGH